MAISTNIKLEMAVCNHGDAFMPFWLTIDNGVKLRRSQLRHFHVNGSCITLGSTVEPRYKEVGYNKTLL